jgi:hypothetical protein
MSGRPGIPRPFRQLKSVDRAGRLNPQDPAFLLPGQFVFRWCIKPGRQLITAVQLSPVLHNSPHLLLVSAASELASKRHDRWPDLGVDDGRGANRETRHQDLKRPDAADGTQSWVIAQSLDDGDPEQRLAPHSSCVKDFQTAWGFLPNRYSCSPTCRHSGSPLRW